MVAESKSASPREVGTLLINLSQETSALHKPGMWLPKALTEPPVISLLGKMVQFTTKAKNHDPFNNLSIDTVQNRELQTKENSLIEIGECESYPLCVFYFWFNHPS